MLLGIYQIELKIHVHKTKQNKQNKNPQKTKKPKQQQQQKTNKTLHMDVYCSFIHNYRKLESNQEIETTDVGKKTF